MSSPSIRLAQVLDDDSDPNIRLMPQQQQQVPFDPKQKNAKDEIHILDGKNSPQNISLYGFLLGMVCSAGLMFSLLGHSKIPQFGIFLAALSLFHFLEYIATALFNADKLSLDSYLINHSPHYHAAHAAALIEFLVEYYFFPTWKTFSVLNYLGLALIIIGQGSRTIAMFSCRHNFSHHIADFKERDHVLVQHGIYSIMRHPSYFGFYWWALGVQVLLMNPICFLLFVYWLQKFFSERIAYEEHTLHRFFGQEWVQYKSKTPTWMHTFLLGHMMSFYHLGGVFILTTTPFYFISLSFFLFYLFLKMVPLKESHFLKLPSEILQRIIHLSALKPDDDDVHYEMHGWPYPEHSYIHLKSIALCCRRLYILVAPFLWRDKEFILPREDDKKSEHPVVQMATDILSKKALFQEDYFLGDYVRSLSRDLTHGPHYNLTNSKLMAQLVSNLRALRIDFHPSPRTEEYGLRYFVEYCPHLSELYLTHCRDTFDDFLSLHKYKPPLTALTLIGCTIKEETLEKLATHSLPLLSKLFLQQVVVEPLTAVKTNTHLIDTTLPFLHPFHYQDTRSTLVPPALYQSFIQHHHLTQLALSDTVNYKVIAGITHSSPHLEKLAIALHDIHPYYVHQSLQAIGQLSSLSVLSIAFREETAHISRASEKLTCQVPALSWQALASKLPLLNSLYISSSRVLLCSDFISTLLDTSPQLSNVIIHNIALVKQPSTSPELLEAYVSDLHHKSYAIEDWGDTEGFYTYKQAKDKGFECFDEGDRVCYIRGFAAGV